MSEIPQPFIEFPSEHDLILLDAVLAGAASEKVRRLLLLVLVGAPRIPGISVAPKDRGALGGVLRLWRDGEACFDVRARKDGTTWWIRTPELRRGRIDLELVRATFPDARADRAGDSEIVVRVDDDLAARRMIGLIAARG